MSTEACPSCHASPPAGARFCPACGTRLDTSAAGERRVVTVVFADLAGFTSMAEGRDPEAVKELLDTCFGALVPVIDEHGGTVDKIIGDELMAVFGAPRAHEDDPERAVRAGVALLGALEALDASLEMRVGINTGEVLAGPVGPGGAYTVTGDTVNTAHRLVGVAPPGTVLVAGATHAATATAIAYGPATSFALRGRREPVLAYAAVGALHRPGARLPGDVRLPLVGRDAELAGLVARVEALGAHGGAHRLAVLGEAGLGKTRLLDELARVVVERPGLGRVAAVHCAPYGGAGPLAPLADLVRLLLEVDETEAVDAQRAQVATRAVDLAEASGLDARYLERRLEQLLGLGALPAPHALTGAPGRSRLSDELLSVVRVVIDHLATLEPLLLVVDDAHFADPLVLDLLERAPVWARARPVLVVVAGREELGERHPSIVAGGPGEVLRLDPLDDAAAGALVQQTLAALDRREGALAAEAEEHVLRAAGGNPLLLDQLVRYLRETDAIVLADGGWRADRPLAGAGIPDGARALLGARLDALPDAERAVLQRAAVVGRSFAPATLRALGVVADDEVLVRLWRRGLVLVGEVDGELAFRHAMVREAAYASVPLGERAAQHERLARWLLEPSPAPPAGPEPDVTGVAHHLERAVSLRREVHDPSAPLEALAAEQLLRAARTALARDELHEAVRWYERLEDLDLLRGPALATAALEHGSTLITLRRLPEAEAVLGALVADGAEPATVGEAATGLGVVARLQGDAAAARAWFDLGRRSWQAVGDLAGEARSVRTHGWAELMAGRPRAALPKLLRARDLEEGAPAPSGVTLQCLAWSEFLVGDHAAARAHLWEAAEALSQTGDRLGLGWCFGLLGNSLWQEGRVAQARGVAESLLSASASGQGDPWGAGMCHVLLAGCRLEEGDLDGARRSVDEALRTFAELADPWGEANARLLEGMVARVAGDLEGATRALELGLLTAAQVASVGAEARLRAELAATLLDRGDVAGAAREARATLGLVRRGGGDRDSEIRALVVLAKRARATGDDVDAGLLLEEAITLAGGAVRTSIWRRAVAISALLAAETGSLERATRLAEAADDGAWESARTWILAQRARAAAAGASGDAAGSLAILERAIERFDGRPLAFVEPALEEAEHLRRALGAPTA